MSKGSACVHELYKLDNYWWHDGCGGHYARSTLSLANDNLGRALKYVQHCRIVVQAGGYTGIWPAWLASRFRRVYTFEPELNNFRALVANNPFDNVFPFRAFLGEQAQTCDILVDRHSGSSRVNGKGNIPMLTIDSLYLSRCDLIQLDVERYEAAALHGAIETIKKYRPIIMVEALSKRSTDPYHWSYDDTQMILRENGYEILDKINKDVIWGYSK